MPNKEIIKLKSYQDTVIEHEYVSQNSDTLFVLLPGLASTVHSPLINYSTMLALDLKSDYVAVNYCFHVGSKPYRQEHFWQLVEDVKQVIDSCLAKKKYQSIVFVGKSLGSIITMVLETEYRTKYKIHLVLLTPIPEYTDKIIEREQFIAFGTADHFINQSVIDNYQKRQNITTHVIKSGDHGLNVDGAIASIDVIKKLMIDIKAYLKNRL